MRPVLMVALLFVQSQVGWSQAGIAPATSGGSQVISSEDSFPGLDAKVAGPFSFAINLQSRAAFEMIAAQAGLNVVFLRDFQSRPVQLRLDRVNIYVVLDTIAAESNSFWQPYNSKTVIIANESIQNHRDIDLQRLKPVFLKNEDTPQQVIDVINSVRRELPLRTAISLPTSRTIVVDDTPGNVALAERRIADLDNDGGAGAATTRSALPAMKAYETDAPGNAYVIEGADRRNITPRRSSLQPSSIGPFSFEINGGSRGAFETIASKCGLTVVFDRDYPTALPISMKLNDVDIYAALDLVSIASGSSGSFWIPFGSKTIFIANGTSTKHRDYDSLTLEVINLTGPKTAQELNDVMNVLRQSLNLTTLVALPRTNSLVFKENPAKVALAEEFIAELDGRVHGTLPATPTLSIEINTAGSYGTASALFSIEPGGVRRNITPKPKLQPKSAGPVIFRLSEDARRAFEILGEGAGINVRFDPQFTPGPAKEFRFDNEDIFEALDILSLQTKNFWQVVDSRNVLVAPDIPTARQAIEPRILKTFQLMNTTTAQDLNDIVNVVRQTLSLRDVKANSTARTIDIRDTLINITLAEKLIGALDKPATSR